MPRLMFLISIITLVTTFNCSSVTAKTLILNNPTDVPLTTPQGNGLLDIVVGTALSRIGYKLKLIKLPAERALRNANAGIDDGDISRIEGLEKLYPNLVRVPEKLYEMKFVAFSRKVMIHETNWKKLWPYSVGLIKGWKILEQGVENHPNVLNVRNADLLFQLLKKDHVDVVLYSQSMGVELAKNKGIVDLKVLQPALVSREMFMYLHKKHADIVPDLVNALRELKNSGMYQKIYNEKIDSKTN